MNERQYIKRFIRTTEVEPSSVFASEIRDPRVHVTVCVEFCVFCPCVVTASSHSYTFLKLFTFQVSESS